MITGVITQQPWEIQDYDLEYTERLAGSPDDFLVSVEAVITPSGGTLDAQPTISGTQAVKVWVQGGADGEDYTIEIRAITNGGRRSESELLVQIGDYK